MKSFIIIVFSLFLFEATAQTYNKIENLSVTDLVTKKFKVESTTVGAIPCPVMTQVQMDAIVLPLPGSCVYNTNTDSLQVYDGTDWIEVGSGAGAGGGISNWETAKLYEVGDVVIESLKIYQANTQHLSTVFASDIANWTLISGVTLGDATGVLNASSVGNLTASKVAVSDASGNLSSSSVSTTTLDYLDATSSVQTQLNGKEPTITGAATSITGSNLSVSKALVSDASGKVAASSVTSTTLGFLDATSSVQTQLNGKEPTITVLPLTKGGTNKNMTAVNGGVVYTDADSQEVSAVGTSGQILQSNGAAAPTWVAKSISSAPQVTESAVSVESLYVPNDSLTQLTGNTRLLETGNNNILSNPSFESPVAPPPSWTVDGNASSEIGSGNFIHGNRSLLISSTGATVGVQQLSTRYAASFADGVQCMASARVKTTRSSVQVCALNAGDAVLCADVNTDGKWMSYKVPFVCGATSNGIYVGSSVVGSGGVYVDDVYVGTDAGIADVSAIETQSSYRQATESKANGTKLFGALTTSSGSALYTYNSGTGDHTTTKRAMFTFTCGARAGATGNASCSIVVNGTTIFTDISLNASNYTGVSAHSVVLESGSTFYFQNNGSAVNTTENYFSVSAISAERTQVFATNCGANCENVFTAYLDVASGTISTENVDFISAVGGTSTTRTVTFTSGVFTTAPTCETSVLANVTTALGKMGNTVVSSTGITNIQVIRSDTGTGITNGTVFIICQKQGADYTASRQIIGSFKEVMTAPGISKPKTCFIWNAGATNTTACSASPCTEYFDSCGTATACTRTNTGVYSCVFGNGTWANSSPVYCTGHAGSLGGSSRPGITDSNGSITVQQSTFNSSFAIADTFFGVQCTGQAP